MVGQTATEFSLVFPCHMHALVEFLSSSSWCGLTAWVVWPNDSCEFDSLPFCTAGEGLVIARTTSPTLVFKWRFVYAAHLVLFLRAVCMKVSCASFFFICEVMGSSV